MRRTFYYNFLRRLSVAWDIFQRFNVYAVRFAEIRKRALSIVIGLASARLPAIYRCKRNAKLFCHHFLAEIKLFSHNLYLVFEFHTKLLQKFLKIRPEPINT